MIKFTDGQWVRLPRELGYAEGTISEDRKFGFTNSEDNFAWKVWLPTKKDILLCPESWLTPIDGPTIPEDAPQKNIDSSGHPMITHHEAEVSLVVGYIRSVEHGETDKVCWCPWTPMKIEGRMGRLRSGEHPQCPVHTKEGYLFGFVAYVRRAFAKKPIDGMAFMARTKEEILDAGGVIEEYTTEEGKASARWVE